MASYHGSMLYDNSIGIECPNDGAQLNKCKLYRGAQNMPSTVACSHNMQYSEA